MSVGRYDIYKEVHKGVRKELFNLVELAGSTEFQDSDALQVLKEQFDRSYNLLETHAHSEDVYVEPMVQKSDADLAAKLSASHVKLDTDINNIQDLLSEINPSQSDSIDKGHAFYLQLNVFVSDYLQHINEEEQIVLPLLWKNFDDSVLVNVSIEIRANIPPPVMKNFLACMIPAMNHPERVGMFSAMKQAAPQSVFEGVCLLAKSTLTNGDWKKLDQSINQQPIVA